MFFLFIMFCLEKCCMMMVCNCVGWYLLMFIWNLALSLVEVNVFWGVLVLKVIRVVFCLLKLVVILVIMLVGNWGCYFILLFMINVVVKIIIMRKLIMKWNFCCKMAMYRLVE